MPAKHVVVVTQKSPSFRVQLAIDGDLNRSLHRASSSLSLWDAVAQLVRHAASELPFKIVHTGKPGNLTVRIEGIDDSAEGEYLDEAVTTLLERHHQALGIEIVERIEEKLPRVLAVPSGSLGKGLVLVLA